MTVSNGRAVGRWCARVAWIAGLAGAALADDDRIALGQAIFEGTVDGPPDRVTAVMGEDGFEIPGRALPCSSCHGRDGRGRAEGGVRPTDLRWSNLTRSYGLSHPSGRKHGAYDDRSFTRAVTLGVDPAGNELRDAMPRYRLSHGDAAALLAYVKTLEHARASGVASDRVDVMAISREPSDGTGSALSQHIDRVNAMGGIYGRRLNLVNCVTPGPGAPERAAIERCIADRPPFAVLAPDAYDERNVWRAAEENDFVVIGGKRPSTAVRASETAFFVQLRGVEQASVLASYAAGSALGDEVLLVTPDDDSQASAVLEAWNHAFSTRSGRIVRRIDPAVLRGLESIEADAIVVAADAGTLANVLERSRLDDRVPRVFWTQAWSTTGGIRLNGGSKAEVFVATALLPRAARGDETPWRDDALAFTVTEVLRETLRRAGRDLSRERWVRAAHTLYEFRSPEAPPVTFGVGRHVASGGFVLRADPQTGQVARVSDWIPAS